MNCEVARALISAEIDGEINPGDPVALEAHLAECADCREMKASFHLQNADLRRAFASRRAAAAAMGKRVVAKLRLESRPASARIPWLTVLFSAAAGFLIAVLVIRPWQQPSNRTAPVPPETANSQPAMKKPIAELAYASGAIEMLRPGDRSWTRMQTGEAIGLGTQIRTGPIGRCEFRTLEGSLVRLNSGTDVVFQTNRKIDLAGGQIWSRVEEAEDPFEIRVTQEKATVTALGTQFDVLSHAAETVLTVIQGKTRVNGNGWQEMVEKGQQAKIVAGNLAERRPVRDLAVAATWIDEILKLKGPDNPELVDRMNDLLAQIGEGKMTYMHEKEILQLGFHCAVPLTRFIESDRSRNDRFKRTNAARILAKIAEPWSVPDLIELLADRDEEVRFYAAKALERLTDGVTQGLSPDDYRSKPADVREAAVKTWRTWWKENRDKYPAAPIASKPAEINRGSSRDQSTPKSNGKN
jgi:hypothetical protein